MCDTQEEIDHFWNRLSEGGRESQCGWLKDRFGLSWQIVPSVLPQLLEEAGYRTVQDLAREDADRLAIRTGLGIKKARQIQVGASYFLSTEAREIEDARRHATAAAAAAIPF